MLFWPDLLISVNGTVISPFHKDFTFTKFCKNEPFAKNSESTVCNKKMATIDPPAKRHLNGASLAGR